MLKYGIRKDNSGVYKDQNGLIVNESHPLNKLLK